MMMMKPVRPPSYNAKKEPQRSSTVSLSHAPPAPSAKIRRWRSKPLALPQASKSPRYSAVLPAVLSPSTASHRNQTLAKATKGLSEKQKMQQVSKGAGQLLVRSISIHASRSGRRCRTIERRGRSWKGRRKGKKGRACWGCWQKGPLVRKQQSIVLWTYY